MSKVLLGDVAVEHKETCKDSKDGYPIVGLEHLIPEEITLTAWDEGSENTFTKMFRKGNVLFGRRRAYLKKAAVAPFDGICSGDITVIEAKPDRILPELLPFIIQNDALFDFAVGKSAGSLSPRVKWEYLKNYEFELPDMAKQRELATLLWAMDETKKSYQKLIAATDELVKSQFIEMFGDIHSNPLGWDVVKFGDTCEILNGYAFKSKLYVDEGIRVIRITNVQKGYIEDADPQFYPLSYSDELSRYILQADDILLSLTGNVGRTGLLPESMLPAALNQRVACIRMKANSPVSKMFLYSMINSDFFEADCIASSQGIAQKNMSTEWLKDYPVIVPPENLQEEYVAFVHQSDKSKFELEQALAELTAIYKRIIAENLG